MKFTLAAAFVSLAATAFGQNCPEAARFGVLSVSPATVKVGQQFTVFNNLTCAPVKGIHPQFIDYYLEVPSSLNNGHQPPLYLARSNLNTSRTPDVDELITSVPQSPTITSFPNSTAYQIVTHVIYPIQGNDGNPVLIAGGTEVGITVNSS